MFPSVGYRPGHVMNTALVFCERIHFRRAARLRSLVSAGHQRLDKKSLKVVRQSTLLSPLQQVILPLALEMKLKQNKTKRHNNHPNA
mmetsp:Transcript_13145/g.26666  ORF Transcript_13145/g.26666 Transcript_13145/m.26666 type:complete len:87 (-) Transcript_13145:596-856(-)